MIDVSHAYYRERAFALHVPDTLHDGLIDYIFTGRPVGGFLHAVLTNDLKEACARADLTNRYRLFDIVMFLYSVAPMRCWGSEEKVQAWISSGGLESETRTL